MRNDQCRVCGAVLPGRKRGARGRPADYCGPVCRKTAELEVRRANLRLGQLEDQASRFRISLDGGDYGVKPDTDDRRRITVKLTAIEAEVGRQQERLRTLLGDGDPQKGA